MVEIPQELRDKLDYIDRQLQNAGMNPLSPDEIRDFIQANLSTGQPPDGRMMADGGTMSGGGGMMPMGGMMAGQQAQEGFDTTVSFGPDQKIKQILLKRILRNRGLSNG